IASQIEVEPVAVSEILPGTYKLFSLTDLSAIESSDREAPLRSQTIGYTHTLRRAGRIAEDDAVEVDEIRSNHGMGYWSELDIFLPLQVTAAGSALDIRGKRYNYRFSRDPLDPRPTWNWWIESGGGGMNLFA